MLVLGRKAKQSVLINSGGNVMEVVVIKTGNGQTQLGFRTVEGEEMEVRRTEIVTTEPTPIQPQTPVQLWK
jgi:sRNA-binding carbon storage regulator CsrA